MTTGMQAVLMWAALSFAGFLGHLVGDYLVQTGWMAANKAKPLWAPFLEGQNQPVTPNDAAWGAITLHALTWALSVAIFVVSASWTAWGAGSAISAAWACLALGAVHWVQDRRWSVLWFMRHTGKDASQVWLVIVVDNVWHLLQVAAAAAWIVWKST